MKLPLRIAARWFAAGGRKVADVLAAEVGGTAGARFADMTLSEYVERLGAAS